MNDPLHHAEMALDEAYNIRNRDHWGGDRAADAAYHVQRAQVFAAIAQAKELKRIADSLAAIASGGYGIDVRGSSPIPVEWDEPNESYADYQYRGYVDSPQQGRVWMRSSWEIEYAKHLTSRGVSWLYEPRRFELGVSFTYCPDFYLPDTDEWKEVKGYMTERDHEKLRLIREVYGIQVDIISWEEMREMGLRTRPNR